VGYKGNKRKDKNVISESSLTYGREKNIKKKTWQEDNM
jgi:hypothetical protein